MAGDWIKMRGNLWDDPRVARLCDITDQSEAAVIGALYWLWSTADQHTADGVMPGLTLRSIDRKTGLAGFGQALCDIGWLADHPEGVRIVKFEEHNGTSAKRRCSEAQRKANTRNVSASDADKMQTEGGEDADEIRRLAELEKEKRREEEIQRERASARGLVGLSLKSAGLDPMSFNLDDPKVDALIAAGATPDQWKGLASEALNSGKSKPWHWVLAVLPERLKAAQAIKTASRHAGFAAKDYRAGVTDDGSIVPA